MIKKKKEEKKRCRSALKEYRAVVRFVKDTRHIMEGDLFGRFLLKRIEHIQAILGKASKATYSKLVQAHRLIQCLVDRFKAKKYTQKYEKKYTQSEYSNLKNKGSLEKLESNNQDFCATTAQNKTTIKSSRKVEGNETELETLLEPKILDEALSEAKKTSTRSRHN